MNKRRSNVAPKSLLCRFSICAGLLSLASCVNGRAVDTPASTAGKESTSQVAAAGIVGSIVTSDTIASSTGFYQGCGLKAKIARVYNELIVPPALATGVCPTAPFGRTPSGVATGATITLLYPNCTPPGVSNAFWNGSQVLTFDSGTGLGAYVQGSLSSGYMTRTFGGRIGSTIGGVNPSSATYRIGSNNTVVYMDSYYADVICYAGASGCNPSQPPPAANALAGQFGVTTQFASNSTRVMTINGLRMVGATNTATREASWDYTLISGPITVNGFGANKWITSGTITVFNNKENYTATTTLQSLQWTTPSCHPTTGRILTTCKPGSEVSVETLDYNGAGQALLTDCTGLQTTVALDHCT